MQTQKFIVDAMLGKLARWLRILGYDTLYDSSYEDWKIIKTAEEQKRIIITRDRGLCNRAKKKGLECFMVNPDYDIANTLAQLARKYKIDLHVNVDATRCSECNGILLKVGDNKWQCSRCKKVYWKGRHWRTIEEILIKAQSRVESNEGSSDNRGTKPRGREKVSKDSQTSDNVKAEVNRQV
ncbi:MAG: hypothetical protein ASUL_05201 [Candidatus Aramenus sulfurataquae]|jgi:uncharacterized protein with PIN domain|uniref:Mut7-C RNAse domain-containing protein n=2 Tax=Candidatus Aramenus sulfurataquae TaxID=1326980 RepID=W7KXF7_9CREN|nr:MAG: hypothetical protein ASUL_05201 [Candidatus Aramenus sulfurataquae]MBW9140640.1 hypothetical protein [Candidatus Aramenus sp.]MCL7343262.1 hypothetical protein [Candidatus Aramenus sulfurataquae]